MIAISAYDVPISTAGAWAGTTASSTGGDSFEVLVRSSGCLGNGKSFEAAPPAETEKSPDTPAPKYDASSVFRLSPRARHLAAVRRRAKPPRRRGPHVSPKRSMVNL